MPMFNSCILLVEDDAELRQTMRAWLAPLLRKLPPSPAAEKNSETSPKR